FSATNTLDIFLNFFLLIRHQPRSTLFPYTTLFRSYEEQINYAGVFGQLEYANDNLSAFFQGAVSSQSHVRTEYRNASALGVADKSEKINNPGFNVKGGLAYNINEFNKVFVNGGYYS